VVPPSSRRGWRGPEGARLGAGPWPGFATRSAATPRPPLGASVTPRGQKGSRGGPTASTACLGPPSRYAPGADGPCGPGAAPGRVAPADLSAWPLESVSHGSLVTEDRREGSPLAGGVMFQPLSGPLQAGLRLLPAPLPAAPSARLAARFPLRGGYGLTTLRRRNPAWVRPRLDAGGATWAPDEFGASGPGHAPFGPSLSAPWACPG
jgi:hypothetical protein